MGAHRDSTRTQLQGGLHDERAPVSGSAAVCTDKAIALIKAQHVIDRGSSSGRLIAPCFSCSTLPTRYAHMCIRGKRGCWRCRPQMQSQNPDSGAGHVARPGCALPLRWLGRAWSGEAGWLSGWAWRARGRAAARASVGVCEHPQQFAMHPAWAGRQWRVLSAQSWFVEIGPGIDH
ncbi:hypothetical protein IWW45_002321 [Coemansia sp. RSA 485]|nr:hypothetical protein IWW45_002321 [Coemansia sp. RSA 485]